MPERARYGAAANTVKQSRPSVVGRLLLLNRLIASRAAGRGNYGHGPCRRGWLPDFRVNMLRRADNATRMRKLVAQASLAALIASIGLAGAPDRRLRVRARARIWVKLLGLGRDRRFGLRWRLRSCLDRQQQQPYRHDNPDLASHRTLPFSARVITMPR